MRFGGGGSDALLRGDAFSGYPDHLVGGPQCLGIDIEHFGAPELEQKVSALLAERDAISAELRLRSRDWEASAITAAEALLPIKINDDKAQ